MPKIKVGLKIQFIYKGEEQTEDIFDGLNDVWFNFNCLYPGALVLNFEEIYRN